MIDLSFLQGQTLAVLGLGASGLATARALRHSGVAVAVWDDAPEKRATATAEGFQCAEPTRESLAGWDGLVLSPGIPRTHPAPHPAVTASIETGCPILSDIDLLARAHPKARFLGITGTNGKSTTTALTGHLLHTAGVPVAVGGNLGPAALSLPALPDDGWYVLELSSYQLETITEVAWSIGILLNLSADHLDRYADFDSYVAAKSRLFTGMTDSATAVIGCDDEPSRQLHDRFRDTGPMSVISISTSVNQGIDVWADRGWLYERIGGSGNPRAVVHLGACQTLPGRHNHQNACAAYAACRAIGVPTAPLVEAFSSFPGLPHRQQLVARHRHVGFVNDSKATNPEAAMRALASYPAVYWIAGGLPKPGGFDILGSHTSAVRGAFVFGTAATAIEESLKRRRIPITRCADLAQAVRQAYDAARTAIAAGMLDDAIVLLSPACASFDQFANFEDRGNRFIEAVKTVIRDDSGGAA